MNNLVERLEKASYAYHNGQTLLMTDAEFDAGLEALRAQDPKHPFLSKVGAPISAGDEVILPIPLPSLNKTKDQAALSKWATKCKATPIMSHANWMDAVLFGFHRPRNCTLVEMASKAVTSLPLCLIFKASALLL